ncbi:MAG: hypothetical protein Q9162_007227 [Coniocarpon cinnabarinum]
MTASSATVAVLDDYQSLSPPHFEAVLSTHSNVRVAYFPETLNPRTPQGLSSLASRLVDYDVIVTMRERTPFPASLLTQLPKLKLLLTTGPKNASIDLEQCKAQRIVVAGTSIAGPAASRYPKPDATTQHTWALILGLAKHITRDHSLIVGGAWQGPCLSSGVSGKTLGLVGLGRLGTAVGRIAVQAWGMKVIVWSPNMTQKRAEEQAKAAGLDVGDFKYVNKERLFAEADVVSVQMVLSDRSRGIVSDKELKLMKRSALFVNTSRGPLVDEGALLRACQGGTISGAALDVFDVEPLPRDSPWRTTKWGFDGTTDVVLSPHTGYGQDDVVKDWYRQNADNLRRWLDGEEIQSKL